MPLGDKTDRAGPAPGFFDFGFFGSRLPRFIPLAIYHSSGDARTSSGAIPRRQDIVTPHDVGGPKAATSANHDQA